MDTLLNQLEAQGVLRRDQRRVVEIEHRHSGRPVELLLCDTGFVSFEHVQAIRGAGQAVHIDVDTFVPDADAVAVLDEAIARQHNALPLALDRKRRHLSLAVVRIDDVRLKDGLKSALPSDFTFSLRSGGRTEILSALDRCYGLSLDLDELLASADEEWGATDALDGSYQLPIVRLVDAVLHDAVTQGASDIHLSPEEHHLRIRYRIDGVLIPVRCVHRRFWNSMLVRLKVLSGLDIAESRLPQDGQLSRTIRAERVEFRVSCFPVRTGENVVLRVLDTQRGGKRLHELSLPDRDVRALRHALQQPAGLVVICGPTGSGKTTTLYALLREFDTQTCNIMTLEDPVEFPLPGIRQTDVGAGSPLDFVAGVRSLLRQDPDVLLLGEVRDEDSCRMAVRAALTGHLVLTTVHANSAVLALQRLRDLGADTPALVNTLSIIMAQRLLRKRCADCGGDGCDVCRSAGYRGRAAVTELLVNEAGLRALLLADAPVADLFDHAIREGMHPLADSARGLVSRCVTDSAEVRRVLGSDGSEPWPSAVSEEVIS